MATIDRSTLSENNPASPDSNSETAPFLTGLRIAIRATTSSLADYPEFSLNDLLSNRSPIVTDGACS